MRKFQEIVEKSQQNKVKAKQKRCTNKGIFHMKIDTMRENTEFSSREKQALFN